MRHPAAEPATTPHSAWQARGYSRSRPPCKIGSTRAMRLALYQPDIPQNAGAVLRLGACLGVPVDVIEPCGFVLSDRRLKRAGMDYIDAAIIARHASWASFAAIPRGRLGLLPPKGDHAHHRFAFPPDHTPPLG